jgi:hypothetical protein
MIFNFEIIREGTIILNQQNRAIPTLVMSQENGFNATGAYDK